MVKYVQPVVNQGEFVHYQAHGYVLILLQRSEGQILPSPRPEARVTANVVDLLRRGEKEQVGACTTLNLDKRDLPGS